IELAGFHKGWSIPNCAQRYSNSDKAGEVKPIASYMEEAGIGVEQLATAARLEGKVVKAIATGNYTPSPEQRERLAAVLGGQPGASQCPFVEQPSDERHPVRHAPRR